MTLPASPPPASISCPNCRYDRVGLPAGVVCPECGAAAPKRGLREDDLDPASSKATIAMGMAVLAWIGLIGFGIMATPIGLGAFWVAWRASRDLAARTVPDPRTHMMIGCAAGLGLGAAVAGLITFVGLLLVL